MRIRDSIKPLGLKAITPQKRSQDFLGSSGPDAGDMPTAIVLHDLNSNIRKPQAFHFFLDYFGNLPL
jgi:hypothetical protein